MCSYSVFLRAAVRPLINTWGRSLALPCDLYSEGNGMRGRKTIFDTLKALAFTPITVEDN